jgi:hypothetical protein
MSAQFPQGVRRLRITDKNLKIISDSDYKSYVGGA